MSEHYWVPEDAMFANAGDCLDKFPDLGAAALVYSQSAYDELERTIEFRNETITALRQAIAQERAKLKVYEEALGNAAKAEVCTRSRCLPSKIVKDALEQAKGMK